ncbi:MAG: hypothetical protein EOR86_04155 [Mesorhizobium sp.]|uniref:hypothetical protein n=1 Tax=Mesorhizobium sp. TaxID=1871066 RepID=UPI000FE53488|nr:hypothetical protein [Mesorhizobium sp.]RWN01053.1 MAG: hypothetical protein EOR86_04155 [Mesorhizobium sp.]
MAKTSPGLSNVPAYSACKFPFDEQELVMAVTEVSPDRELTIDDGLSSFWLAARPLRERSPADQLELAAQRLKVRRSIGFLPPAEATWLCHTDETHLDSEDLTLMEQLAEMLRGVEGASKIATHTRKPAADIATTPEVNVATAESNASGPATSPRQGLAGREPPPCAVAPTRPSLISARPSGARRNDRGNGPSHPCNHQVPSWDRLTPNQRFLATIETAARNKGLAVTLAFSAGREQTLMASTGPTRLLTHYLNRGLKAAGVTVPYSLRLEVSPEGRLHAHGVLIAGGPAGACVEQLKSVLVSAAGKIQGRAGSKQCVFREIHYGAGWHRYLLKSHRKTAKALGTEKTAVISRGMLQMARAEYEVSGKGLSEFSSGHVVAV